MTLGGWIFMTVSVSFVVVLVTYCFYRVLFAPGDITEPPESLGG